MLFELSECCRSGALRFIAVNGFGNQTVFEQMANQLICAVFGSGKDQNLIPLVVDDKVAKDSVFISFRNSVKRLANKRGVLISLDFDGLRLIEEFGSELFNFR